MNIAVCIKWIPVVARMKFDVETRRIVREGVPGEVNNWDLVAVQRAVELREQFGGTVTAITMGPPQARDGIIRCYAQGADKGMHINDRALAGSDTLATSRVLGAALHREQYDLVLMGNFSTDAETGQVGPEVAELLGLPQITGAAKLNVDGTTVRVERNLDDAVEVLETSLPVLVTVADGVASDAFPGRDAMMAAREREVDEVSLADLGLDPSQVGASGSPTWVSEIRIDETSRQVRVIEDEDVQESVEQVVAYLHERGVLDPSVRAERIAPPTPESARPAIGPGVWVSVELDDAGLARHVSHELLAAAQPIADAIGGHVTALLFGAPGVNGSASDLGSRGADEVLLVEDESLREYSTDAYSATLATAIEREQPYAVLLPSTIVGRDLAGRVAARLSLGLTGDCVGFEVDPEGRLAQLKPAFGGNVVAPVYSKTLPNMATVRPGIFEALAPAASGRGVAVRQMDPMRPGPERVRRVDLRPVDVVDVAELDDAWAVVGVGMGVAGAEFLGELEPLREVLGAQYVTTRDVADAGWMPRQLQVGLTGRSIAPDLYIGVGTRGDANHLIGLRRAGVLVIVNNNRRSNAFRGGVDVAVLADWHEFVPALTEALRRELTGQ